MGVALCIVVLAWIIAICTVLEHPRTRRRRQALDALEMYFLGVESFAVANKTIALRGSVLRRLFPKAEFVCLLTGLSERLRDRLNEMRAGTSNLLEFCCWGDSELRLDASDRIAGEFAFVVTDDETGVRLPATQAFFERRRQHGEEPPEDGSCSPA